MALTQEGLVWDSLDLNDLTNYRVEGLQLPFGKKRHEWIEGADADGSVLARDPLFDMGEGFVRIRVEGAADMDEALAKARAVVQKCEECEKQRDGLPLVHTAGGRGGGSSESLTFYILSAEVEGIPITAEGEDAGYWFAYPVFTVKLYAKPFGYGDWVETITDDFSADSIADYTFDDGAGTLAVSGGQLVPSSTAEKILYHSARGHQYQDAQVTLKVTTGAVVAGSYTNLLLRRALSTHFLWLHADGTNIRLFKREAGVDSALSANVAGALSPGTAYWFRFRVEGVLLTGELWTSAPTPTGTPAASVTYTLAEGADAYFIERAGYAGMRLGPGGTDWRYDDFKIEPNVWHSSLPILTGTIPHVEGDVPAEARAIVTDNASQSRRTVILGLEQRHYDPATSLLVESADLVTSGFAGSSVANGSAYGGSSIRAVLTTTPVVVCGTGNLGHVGQYRVYARVSVASVDARLRLSWQEGDGPLRSNPYATAPGSGGTWFEVDLGLITIPEKQLGTQRWSGRIEAYEATTGNAIDVDYLLLIPAGEGFGKAREPIVFETLSAFAALDSFEQSAGNLNGKTANIGGNWATSGSTTDFAVEATGHTAQRSTGFDSGPRWAISGLAASAAQFVQIDFKTASPIRQGVIARWTDSNNYVRATQWGGALWQIEKVVAGVATVLGDLIGEGFSDNAWYTVRLVIDDAGRWFFWNGDSVAPLLSGQDSALATGGTLASGKVGIFDENPAGTGHVRNYDNFLSAVPTSDAVIFSGQSAEFRSDGAIREDSTGTYWGNIPAYRGSRFYLPEAGDEDRTSRIAVLARRNDIEAMADGGVTDSTTVQIIHRSRFLGPR